MEQGNFLRVALQRADGPSMGLWQMVPGANVSRALARVPGVDWVVIDCEHGNLDDSAMHEAVPAVAAAGASPIVRIPGMESWMIKRALDSGAHGILVPLLRTAQEAREIVKAAKFPPQGTRGFGSPYAMERFSPMPTMTEYLQQANSSLLTVVQIETQEALNNLDEIAAVDGVDILFVGPFDLGNNIGHPILQGIVKPELQEAVARVLEVSHRFGKKCGIYSTSGKQAREYSKAGFDMIHVATDFTSLQFIMTQEVNIAKGREGTEKGDDGVHWQQSNQLPPESETDFSDELLPAFDGGIGLCFDQTPLEDLTFGCPDLAADNFELDHIHASSLDSLSQQEIQRYSHSDGVSPYNLQRAFSTSSLANQELSETDTSTNLQYPAIPITPNSTLPRRRSRYSLRHTLNGGRSIYIPVYDASEQASEPLQRWRNSPPETESASWSAIYDTLQGNPLSDNMQAPFTRVESSSPSVASWHSQSSSSIVSTQSSRSFQNRNRRRVTKRRSEVTGANKKPRIFHCTFCCDSFSKKHDWTRHEKTLHLDCDQWICAPYGGAVVSSSTGRSTCAYCNILDPTENHLNSHNHNACHNGQQPHIFRRKDNLIQHLRGFHQLDTLPILDDWRIPPPPISSRCGFCDQHLASWQDRADHLTQHFRQGKTMAEWKGDHNFEPSIAAQVRNALPPYLLANEALTMVPFSATDPKVPDHFAQIEERNGKNLPDPEQQLDPGFDLTPDSYTKFLAWHLGRFAQQSFASGVFPTDEMFQGEARRLFYGSDDKWEQTIADNEQWIATFRRQHLSKD
ncbi:hypothetical protein NW756_009680 [Fusarium oxysporum]|nr:hypothetical protein NW753_009859 [Fusarium oxysporum]KAJ4083479.1 hypothetical protein NW756_009680 [Fusarium oxysporum]